jgi:hypothetical protein
MKRQQLVLLGLLVVQLLLIVLVRSPFSTANPHSESRPLFPGMGELEPSRLELLGPEDEQVTLVRNADGWTVEQAGGYPADETKIEGLVDQLAALAVRRPIVSSGRYHEAFEIDDEGFRGRVRVWGDSDEPYADLVLGSSPNYRVSHARVAGENEVYEIAGLAPYDVSPEVGSWAEKKFFDLPQDAIVGVKVENAAGGFELERVDGAWRILAPAKLAGREPDPDKVNTLLRTVSGLRIEDPIGPTDETAFGFDTPASTVTIRWSEPDEDAGAGSGVAVIRVGGNREGQETQRYVTRSGFEFTASIWESTVKKLIEQGGEDLLPQPETDAS